MRGKFSEKKERKERKILSSSFDKVERLAGQLARQLARISRENVSLRNVRVVG